MPCNIFLTGPFFCSLHIKRMTFLTQYLAMRYLKEQGLVRIDSLSGWRWMLRSVYQFSFPSTVYWIHNLWPEINMLTVFNPVFSCSASRHLVTLGSDLLVKVMVSMVWAVVRITTASATGEEDMAVAGDWATGACLNDIIQADNLRRDILDFKYH